MFTGDQLWKPMYLCHSQKCMIGVGPNVRLVTACHSLCPKGSGTPFLPIKSVKKGQRMACSVWQKGGQCRQHGSRHSHLGRWYDADSEGNATETTFAP